ncbi:hypothetical protein NMG60_11003687, partial [Bertholletia excelsa]
ALLLNDDWPQLIQLSIGSKNFLLGEAVHGLLAKFSYQNNTFMGNNLINMYVKFNRLENARQVFDEMLDRNTVTWTSLINGYSQMDDIKSVIKIAHDMHKSHGEFNEHTFSVILRVCGCGSTGHVFGEQIHGFVIKNGFSEDLFVGTSLVSMYSRSGHLDDAEKIFNELKYLDLRSLNFMILEYGNAGYGEKALELFLCLLHHRLEPNDYTFTNLICACNGTLGLEEGKQLHGLAMKHGLVDKSSVGNTIITMYGRHGLVGEAEIMFHKMGDKNLISWTALLSSYVKNGSPHKAFAGLLNMVNQGLNLDSDCLACVLDGCSECQNLDLGLQIHGLVTKLGLVYNVNVGTAIVDLYAKCRDLQSARLFLKSLGVVNTKSFNAFLTGFTVIEGGEQEDDTMLFCSANQASQVRGASLHGYAIKTGFEAHLSVANAAITMYAKCGSILDAYQMFICMKDHDLISWNAMISAHSLHGQGEEAVSLFEEMVSRGFSPDKITILAVLQACSYSGLFNYGICLFHEMELKYGIRPILEHFACMVDLLGRARLFSEAMDFISKSPFSDSPLLWRTLVNVCKLCGDLYFGKMASKRLLDLAPQEAGSYVLISNMYAGGGMFEEAAMVRTLMNDLKISKEVGCSWIEINNRTHKFAMGSKDHPSSIDIYANLDLLRFETENIDSNTNDFRLIWDPA